MENMVGVEAARGEPFSEVEPRNRALESTGTAQHKSRLTETNWDLFRLFFSVARTGSVNKAARDLGMSQPTLSRRLKELERNIGAPLFFRVSSGVKLTQEGEDLLRSPGAQVRTFEEFIRQ